MMARDSRPPNPPWRELNPQPEAGGYLSYYYSDELSPLPVRGITLPANNKSDPNIETLTYGLFSTCGHGMRASIVKHRTPYIFFLTNRGGLRVLTGYYHLRWFAPGPLPRKPPDYALAAESGRFIHPGIPLRDLPTGISETVNKRFRVFKRIDADTARALASLLDAQPDQIDAYRAEIARLERFNRFRTGYSYVNWELPRGFGWDIADDYLGSRDAGVAVISSTSSPTDDWQCTSCRAVTHSKALLKRCPACGAMGGLTAVSG